jgi:hypothetical protein
VKKRKRLHAVSGNVNEYRPYRKEHGGSSSKTKKELPYDPAIPLLGICPKNTKSYVEGMFAHTCS